ncbi:28S ribosomal protein S5, mitochondrial [Coelomomyces lativittatus]|nr:28S ribosomal protein S5, mitochondrial [Coelomomyces lativittatus]
MNTTLLLTLRLPPFKFPKKIQFSSPSLVYTIPFSCYSSYSRTKSRPLQSRKTPDEKQIKTILPSPDSLWLASLDTPPSELDPADFLLSKKTLGFIQLHFTASEKSVVLYSPELAPLPPPRRMNLYRNVLHMRKVVKMTGGGKTYSTSVLAVVEDMKGCVAYGEVNAGEPRDAVIKAIDWAQQRIEPIDGFENRTIWSNVTSTFKATHVILRTAPPGFGIRTNPHIHELCKCAGIRDISAKVRGSTNPINVIKATMLALNQQKRMDDIARARGLKIWDVKKVAFGA